MRVSQMLLPLLVAVLLVGGCSPQATSQSDLDTPEYHYRLGVRSLEAGDYTTARGGFQRAIDLDKKFALGWSGLGLAQAYMGNVDMGKSSVDKGVSLDSKIPDTHTYRARYYIVIQTGRWFKSATDALDKALKISPGNEAATFYYGEASFFAMQFQQAGSYFGQVVDMKGALSGKADSRWETTQKIVRARPGTDAGRRIAIKAQISRADLAVLFAEELKLTELFSRSAQSNGQATFQPPSATAGNVAASVPSDVMGSWAEPWIKEALELGVFEADPSGLFYPEESVTRVGYAMAVQRILTTATGNSALETKYFGEATSRFSDVPSSHFAYNAMSLSAERGIMKADMMTGKFNPGGNISGADALLIIREIQNNLRITF